MTWVAKEYSRPGDQDCWPFLWLQLPGRSGAADILTSRKQRSGFLCRNFPLQKWNF